MPIRRTKLHTRTAEAFSKNIKKLRGKMTQQAYSEKLQDIVGHAVSLETLKNWEQCYNLPELKDIIAIADYYNYDVDYLVGRIEEKTMDIHNICLSTGLSKEAVEILQQYQLHATSPIVYHGGNEQIAFLPSLKAHRSALADISAIIENKELIKNISKFLHQNYDISSVYVAYNYGDNQHSHKRIGGKADISIDNILLNDSIKVDSDILSETSFNKIRRALEDMKKRFSEK